MDGHDATIALRREKGGEEVKIIALTASAFEEEREKVMEAGFDDFLRKPYREADLFGLMEKHLGVRFLYGEKNASPAALPELTAGQLEKAVTAEALAAPLPEELERQMLELDPEQARTAVRKVREHDGTLADALGYMVDRFRFEEVLSLLEKVRDGK